MKLADSDQAPFNRQAHGDIENITREIEQRKRLLSDPTYSLEHRLEAYEEIADSEIGDTFLIRARNIERELGFRQIFFKFEGGNPTGTQKDRIAFAQCMDAMRRGFDTVALAARGAYGEAMAAAAALAGLRCVIHIPDSLNIGRAKRMRDLGAEIIFFKGDYGQVSRESGRTAREKEYYDANPGGENTTLQLMVYGQIAYEIYDELRDAPLIVATSISNGTTLAGVYRGFLSLHRRGKTSRVPRMVAGSAFRDNPIVRAFVKGMHERENSGRKTIVRKSDSGPEAPPCAFDSAFALEGIRREKGWAAFASDKDMRRFSCFIREREGLRVRPESTAGLIALVDLHRREGFSDGRYVAVLAGKRG